jgi:hypothetical protein
MLPSSASLDASKTLPLPPHAKAPPVVPRRHTGDGNLGADVGARAAVGYFPASDATHVAPASGHGLFARLLDGPEAASTSRNNAVGRTIESVISANRAHSDDLAVRHHVVSAQGREKSSFSVGVPLPPPKTTKLKPSGVPVAPSLGDAQRSVASEAGQIEATRLGESPGSRIASAVPPSPLRSLPPMPPAPVSVKLDSDLSARLLDCPDDDSAQIAVTNLIARSSPALRGKGSSGGSIFELGVPQAAVVQPVGYK